jgi:Fe-S-cluster-containing hydrogenase component 2
MVDMEKCLGCKLCVIACSLVKNKIFNLTKGRLWVLKIESECLGVPVICEQCEDAPCLAVCPARAISKDFKTGLVSINGDKCIGCRECMWICPFGAVTVDFDKGIAIKCDLCNGEPECVKVCGVGAIQYTRVDRPMILKKLESMERRVKALVSLVVKGGGV